MKDKEKRQYSFVQKNLNSLYGQAAVLREDRRRKYAVMSDMHLGDGGRNDDFARNAKLSLYVLKEYYLKQDYTLILNGDIEELQRSSLFKIMARWHDFYELLDKFDAEKRLFKITGNHDLLLHGTPGAGYPYTLHQAVRLESGGGELFLFHGHQASVFFEKFNNLAGILLKYVANPLRIKNLSVSHDSLKRYKVERHAYDFASGKKCIAVIGHTHRPLFESLSKLDSLKFTIEQLCRNYPKMDKKEQEFAVSLIRSVKQELDELYDTKIVSGQEPSLYNARILIPCLFNSGCTIGKRGITSLEIERDSIRLVHWFDSSISRKHLQNDEFKPEELSQSGYYRKPLKQEYLNYIFTRINLLA